MQLLHNTPHFCAITVANRLAFMHFLHKNPRHYAIIAYRPFLNALTKDTKIKRCVECNDGAPVPLLARQGAGR